MLNKKIVVLCHSSSIGGAELALASLMQSTNESCDWSMVLPVGGNIDDRLTVNAHKVHRLDLPWWCHEAHDSPRKINAKRLFSELRKLEKIASDADILLTNTITMPWLSFVATKLKIPHIWHIHEFGDLDHNLQFVIGYKRSLEIISLNSSRVLTISNAVNKHLSQVIPTENIDIIHQSIDFSNIAFSPTNISDPDKQLRLVVLGAIKPSKGQDIAIKAVQLVNSSQPNRIKLDIIGPNANQKYCQKLIKETTKDDNISVEPGSFTPDVELELHDIVVMASNNEALGRVTLEGLAAGKIVIGFACTATQELLSDNRGILYSPNKPEILAKTLTDLQSKMNSINPEYNRKYVSDTYSQTVQATDFIASIGKAKKAPPNPNNTQNEYIATLIAKNLLYGRVAHLKSQLRKFLITRTPKQIKKFIRKS